MLKKKEPSKLSKVSRMDNFLYIFTLRQGTIFIAVHQIALTSFILIILFVGLGHTREMMSALSCGLQDEEEKSRVAIEVDSTANKYYIVNNYDKFMKAQRLADSTVYFLYGGTLLTMSYLVCCILLLHGAIKSKKRYLIPWIFAATITLALLIAGVIILDSYTLIVKALGGIYLYHLGASMLVLSFSYGIFAVACFSLQLGRPLEEGERMLLLDRAANSNLLSAAQFNKMAANSQTNFV